MLETFNIAQKFIVIPGPNLFARIESALQIGRLKYGLQKVAFGSHGPISMSENSSLRTCCSVPVLQ